MEYRTDRVTGSCKDGNIIVWMYLFREGDEPILDGELEASSLEEAFQFAKTLTWEGMSVRLLSPITSQVFGVVNHSA